MSDGQFKKGRATYKDGREYVGEFKEQLFHGQGLLKKENGQVVFDGPFEKGKFHGEGRVTIEKGGKVIKMTGQFSRNKLNGKGYH